MNATIDLSEQNAAALEAQARAAHMPPESYLSKIVARAPGRNSRAVRRATADAKKIRIRSGCQIRPRPHGRRDRREPAGNV